MIIDFKINFFLFYFPEPAIRLPKINWHEIPASKVKITVFSDTDYRSLQSQINLRELEELFKLGARRQESKRIAREKRDSTKKSILSLGRHRSVGVTLKRLKMSVKEISLAVGEYDLEKLSVDRVTILMHLLPKHGEIKAFRRFQSEGGHVEELSLEDQFMFTKIGKKFVIFVV